MAALLVAVALGGTTLTTLPAFAAPAAQGVSHSAGRLAAPTTVVTRLSTASGVATDKILVQGTNLAHDVSGTLTAYTVKFGATAATTVTPLSDSALEVTVPTAGAEVTPTAPGVTITVNDATKGPRFTYVLSTSVTTTQAALTALAPNSETGLAGQTIAGTNFTKATKVYVGGKVAKTTLTSATALAVDYPSGLVGKQDVVVTTPTASKYVGYVTYTATVPTITAASGHAVAELATPVTLTGTNLDLVTSVTYNGEKASFAKTKDKTKLTVTIPKGAVVTGADLVVTTKFGAKATSTAVNRAAAVAPTVTVISGALAGGTVIITGTNLLGLKSLVLTGPSPATTTVSATSIKVESATKATAKLPALAGNYTYTAKTVASAAGTGSLTF